MDILYKLLRILYKVYLFLRERFFLIPPPESHPLQTSIPLMEGMGEGEFEREPAEKAVFRPSSVYASEGGEVLVGKRAGDYEPSPLLEEQHISLCETLDRVLNTGVVVHGDITISVANIDLIYIGLRALLTSVETARRAGINHMTDF
ncbi:MAG: gas vesicle protein [Candidatus Brocadiales bacterium]|nr:gas vesicle protein [Candidatus Brocadiales bacterium]